MIPPNHNRGTEQPIRKHPILKRPLRKLAARSLSIPSRTSVALMKNEPTCTSLTRKHEILITTSRARILFDDPSRSAGSENEAQRKGYAVKFAKVERRTQGKGADYFQKWRTITQTGVLPRRRGCGLFPKLTDFFFLAPNPVRRFYF